MYFTYKRTTCIENNYLVKLKLLWYNLIFHAYTPLINEVHA